MNVPTLWARFQSLKPTGISGAVVAIRCGLDNQHLLVRGERNEPVLLLSSKPREMPRADIQLKHIGVQFDRKFEVESNDGSEVMVGYYCKFTCEPSSSHLHQYFIELMAACAGTHQGDLNPTIVDQIVDSLLELFRKMSPPDDNSVTGLWGELLLIYLAEFPGEFLDAWHLRKSDSFDFSFGEKRIEVKTTEGPSREHEFSLKQIRSGRSTDFIASIVLSRSSDGISVLDLARLIAERLDAVRQGKLWRLVVGTVGDDADGDSDQYFDLKSASDSVVFLCAEDVPAPEVPVSAIPFVTNVKFRANLNVLCNNSILLKESFLASRPL